MRNHEHHPEMAQHDPIPEKAFRWASLALLAYFGLRLIYLALSLSSFVPPDEVTHAGVCNVFSKVFLLPENGPETYEFGLVTNSPWLYYWIMGKLAHLNIFGMPNLVFLRILNLPLAFGTVFYAQRLLRLLTEDRLTRLLLLVIVTNSPMFSVLSASVSYDNLANLLAAMAIYYLFAFFKERSGGLLVASFICQLAGSLTKVTFLPLVLALNVVLLVHEAKHLAAFPGAVAGYFRASGRRAVAGAVLLATVAGFSLQLYGGNYLHYKTLNPPMSMVVSQSAALNFRMNQRSTIFFDYRDGRISYMDALVLAGQIKHPGDKADTFYLLMNYENLKRNPALWMGPLQYLAVWFKIMLQTTMGIKGHLGMFKSQALLAPVYLVLALGVAGFLVRWRPSQEGQPVRWFPLELAGIALFFSAFLMRTINYKSYLDYGEPGLTVYGRYLFPVMVPVGVLLAHYLLQLFRSLPVRMAVAALTALLFIGYDFPWFLAHATPEWFQWLPK